MDPITIAIAGLAGYALVKAKTANDEKKPDNGGSGSGSTGHVGAPGTLGGEGPKGLTSTRVSAGSFHLGGTAPVALQSQPVDAGKVLGTISGAVALGVTVVTIIGGGSLSAGFATLETALASFVPIGTIVALVIIIIAIVVAVCFLVISQIQEEEKELRYGTAGYMEDLRQLFISIKAALMSNVTSALGDKKLSPADTAMVDKYASCFAFVAVRGFNRAMVAQATQYVWQGVQDGRGDIQHVRYQDMQYNAVRGKCVWELGWVSDYDLATKNTQVYLGQWEDVRGGTIESNFFPVKSFAASMAELRAARIWGTSVEAFNQEDSADFLGRALAVQKWSQGSTFRNPWECAVQALYSGMIGRKCGLPGDDEVTTSRQLNAANPTLASALDQHAGTLADIDGKSGLRWYFDESQTTGQTVVR